MMYDNCTECPHNGAESCPFGHRSQDIRQQICQFLRLPIRPLHDDGWIEREAERLVRKIKWFDLSELRPDELPTVQETEYSYEDFHHVAFAVDTPEQQARHFQNELVATAAIADFRKKDITKCVFFVNRKGEARGELPPIS